jgi:hypothetical protein
VNRLGSLDAVRLRQTRRPGEVTGRHQPENRGPPCRTATATTVCRGARRVRNRPLYEPGRRWRWPVELGRRRNAPIRPGNPFWPVELNARRPPGRGSLGSFQLLHSSAAAWAAVDATDRYRQDFAASMTSAGSASWRRRCAACVSNERQVIAHRPDESLGRGGLGLLVIVGQGSDLPGSGSAPALHWRRRRGTEQ